MMDDLFMRLAERAMGSAPVVEPFVLSVYSPKNTTGISSYHTFGQYEEKEDFRQEGLKDDSAESIELTSKRHQTLTPYDLHENMPSSRLILAKDEDISSYNTDNPRQVPAGGHYSDFQRYRVTHGQGTIIDNIKVQGGRDSVIPLHRETPAWIDLDHEKHRISKRQSNADTKPEIPPESIPDLQNAPILLSELEYKKRQASMPWNLLPRKDVYQEVSIPSEKGLPAGKGYREEKETWHSSLPAVQVNIKRIEVRAIIQEPPKPRNIQKTVPKLSLDEYLKQRKEGKR